jgi:hypothetical protein
MQLGSIFGAFLWGRWGLGELEVLTKRRSQGSGIKCEKREEKQIRKSCMSYVVKHKPKTETWLWISSCSHCWFQESENKNQ